MDCGCGAVRLEITAHPDGALGRRPRRDAMAGRHSRKRRRLCQMRNDHVIPAFVLPPRRPWMAQGTGHRAAVAASRPWSSPPASSDRMCQGAALMAWWDWGLAGEGLKIGRSQGARHQAPGLPGQGIFPRGRFSHLGASYGLGPDSRCRVADLHAPVWGIALGWRRQGGKGENETERKEREKKREKNRSAWKCRCMPRLTADAGRGEARGSRLETRENMRLFSAARLW